MGDFNRLWLALRTKNTDDSGSDSEIVLIVNQGGVTDVLEYTFGDTGQSDREEGQANVYEMQVFETDILRFALTNSSIRVGIRGADLWRPEEIFLWGEELVTGRDPRIFPLAIATSVQTTLSTDVDEGAISLPVQLVSELAKDAPIRRLLMLILTSDGESAGTNSPVALQIATGEGPVVDFEIPDTDQNDLESGEANWYWIPVGNPFSESDLQDDSIRLVIRGPDMWRPAKFFLFGVDNEAGRPQAIIRLVHIPEWNLGRMSTDPDEGAASVDLPLS